MDECMARPVIYDYYIVYKTKNSYESGVLFVQDGRSDVMLLLCV